jgi:DnaJ-class molecular chaperone
MTGPTPATTSTARICPNCDGFASAAITIGGRDRHGHLRTVTAHCPACHGLGTVPARRVREGAGA